MTDPVFPSLPGLGWSVLKTPRFMTRVQKAVSGRELRIADQAYPIWEFTLPFGFLRDPHDTRGGAGLGTGHDELRTLMGFWLNRQGSFLPFLFYDPSDNIVTGGVLPAAISTVATVVPNAPGSGYGLGELISPAGGTGSGLAPGAAVFRVAGVSGGGITALALDYAGSYAIVPPSSVNCPTNSSGAGTGATVDLTWLTRTQLVRSMGGFQEPITAPAAVSALYYNGVAQLVGWSANADTGIVTLAAPFTATQPVITADFTYYFRCRFSDDSAEFENFMYQLWTLKQVKFQSVLL